MIFEQLLIVALAAWQIVDTWFRSELFAEHRAHAQTMVHLLEDRVDQYTSIWSWRLFDGPSWIYYRLKSCWYCQLHHAVWMTVGWYFIVSLAPEPWLFLLRLPVYILAVLRLAALGQMLLPESLQYGFVKDFPHVGSVTPDASIDADRSTRRLSGEDEITRDPRSDSRITTDGLRDGLEPSAEPDDAGGGVDSSVGDAYAAK